MLNGVTYPGIKPLHTFSDNTIRHTTITKFDEVLSKEENTIEKSTTANETDCTKTTSDNDNDKDVIYTDPKTGDVYKYIDVSDTKTNTADKVSANAKTTSADSMKKTKYDSYFKKAAKKYNVSESLLKAIAKAESNFNPKDVSNSGAMGIMQLMPATAKELGVSNPYDPEQNIMGGARCIAQKIKEFNGNISLALAAYNAGSGAVKKSGGVPSYCRSYVKKVLSYKEAYETAKAV